MSTASLRCIRVGDTADQSEYASIYASAGSTERTKSKEHNSQAQMKWYFVCALRLRAAC